MTATRSCNEGIDRSHSGFPNTEPSHPVTLYESRSTDVHTRTVCRAAPLTAQRPPSQDVELLLTLCSRVSLISMWSDTCARSPRDLHRHRLQH